MASLSYTEKRDLERLLGMATGVVLDLTTRQFNEFVLDSTGRRIDEDQYVVYGGSKANRLRAFWAIEPDHIVGKLLVDLIAYATPEDVSPADVSLFAACRSTAERLLQSLPVEDIEAINPDNAERHLKLLGELIRDSIQNSQPQVGLDRLHTFVAKYMRGLCESRGISVTRDKPLHSLMGEYTRLLRDAGHIDSEMTERILKSSIATMEAFNRVRNEQSLAHDNPILNNDESLLIFSHVMSAMKFVQTLERRLTERAVGKGEDGG